MTRGLARRFTSALLASALIAGVSVTFAASASAVAPTTAPELTPVDSPTSDNPVFSWSAVPGASKYRIEVSAAANFSPTVYKVDTYSGHATPPTELPNGTLYWRVAGLDSANVAGPWSDVAQFEKLQGTAPTLSSPGDGATLDYPSNELLLVWEPVARAKTYTVQMDDNDTFSSPSINVSTSNTQLALDQAPTLQTPQFWHVRADYGNGLTTTFSSARSFTVQWPTVATSIYPANGAHVSDIRLAWSPVSGAKYYEVEISTDQDFNSKVLLGSEASSIVGTQYAPKATLQPRSYFWHVRAKDTATLAHLTAWSETSSFDLDALAGPSELAPGLDVTQAGVVPTITEPALSWQGVPRASFYELQLGTDENFSPSTYVACTTFHTTYTPYMTTSPGESAPPGAGGSTNECDIHLGGPRYFWRVRGVEQVATTGVFNGTWSPTMSFFFHQDAPQVLAPAEGATTTSPVLRWSPTNGFNKYRVTLQKSGTTTKIAKETYSLSWSPTGATASSTGLVPGSFDWWVEPLDAEDNVGPSDGTHHFTLVAPTPVSDTPSISAPADGAHSTDMPSLEWTPATGATEYKVWYRATGSTTWLPMSDLTNRHFLTAFTQLASPLTPGTYEWYVEAVGVGSSSAISTFVIDPLDRVTHLGPTNCVTVPSCANLHDNPVLSWQMVPYTHFYRVHVSTDPSFANELRVFTTQNTTITFREALPDNQAGNSYYWFVQPCKSPTNCGAMQVDDPGLDPPILPSQLRQAFRKRTAGVQLAAPADGTTVDDDPNLSWTDFFTTNSDGTPGAGAKSYRVQIATDSAFSAPVVEEAVVDATSFTGFTKERPDGLYYWRVQAIDGANQSLTWSETRSFAKLSATPVPNDVGPTTPLPTLSWSSLPYTSGYKVEVYAGDTVATSTAVVSVTTKLPTLTLSDPLSPGGYAWRVAKLDPTANRGPWSATGTFTVAPPAPALVSPADGASLGGNDLLFTWSGAAAGTGVASYKFEATSGTFSSVADSALTVMTAWAPTKFYADNTNYSWRVSALDSKGHVLSTSAVRTFRKDAAAPTVKSVAPTTQWAHTGPITVTFNERVQGISTASLRLDPAGTTSTPVPGSVSLDSSGTVATFTPAATLRPGQNYVLSVKTSVTDQAGNHLAATYTKTLRAATTVDNASAALTELWDRDSNASADGGAFIASATKSAAATFTFTGTSIVLKGERDTKGGYADVYLDGVATRNVSFYTSSTSTAAKFKVPVYSKSGLSNAKHTLKVVVLGTKPAAATAANVYLDSFTVGTVVSQETSTALVQRFRRASSTSASAGTYDTETIVPVGDTNAKPEYRASFAGTGVALHAVVGPTSGKALVYVDGALAKTVDLYSSTTAYQRKVFDVTSLGSTTHSLRVVVSGTKNASSSGYTVALDHLIVH